MNIYINMAREEKIPNYRLLQVVQSLGYKFISTLIPTLEMTKMSPKRRQI
jgi:hypothetical protein